VYPLITFPILLDLDGSPARMWRVATLPATFIIRAGGEVAGMAVCAREWNSRKMRTLIESLLPFVPEGKT
jgi:hypothetical protein